MKYTLVMEGDDKEIVPLLKKLCLDVSEAINDAHLTQTIPNAQALGFKLNNGPQGDVELKTMPVDETIAW